MDKQNKKQGKKRNKSYYIKSSQQKKQKLNKLEAGMRGFLVTCNRDEKQAVKETYNILNEYADNLYGLELDQNELSKLNSNDQSENSSDDEDMEKAMKKEVKVIQESQTRPRRFQNCFTNAKNCIFISTSLDDPVELAHNIFTDLSCSKTQKTRFAIRLLPIAGTCKAYVEDMKKLAEKLLSPFFSTPVGVTKTFAIIFKVRNNNTVSRQVVLPMIGQLISEMNPLHKVHLDNPDLAVLVEVVCSVCCMSVVRDFYKFRKYNLHEVVKDTSGETKTEPKTEKTLQPKEDGDSVCSKSNDTETEKSESCEVKRSLQTEQLKTDEKALKNDVDIFSSKSNDEFKEQSKNEGVSVEADKTEKEVCDKNETADNEHLMDNSEKLTSNTEK